MFFFGRYPRVGSLQESYSWIAVVSNFVEHDTNQSLPTERMRMIEMPEITDGELQRKAKELEQINSVILEGHARLSIAYLGMRVKEMGRSFLEFKQEIRNIVSHRDSRINEMKELCDRIDARISAVDAEMNRRMDGAVKVFRELQAEVKAMKEVSNGNGQADVRQETHQRENGNGDLAGVESQGLDGSPDRSAFSD